jgi:AcrR family transcriptional regulator
MGAVMAEDVGARERLPLSAERIELAALAVIEREGLAGFSLRKLAAALGCTAMSLYHHYPSKGHLMDALVDRMVAGLPPAPSPALPWRARVRAVALAWRRMALAQPALVPFIATHRMNTPRALAFIEATIALFRDGTADDEEAARMFRAVGYYLAGAVLEETAGYARGPSSVAPVPEAAMARDYPHVVASAAFFAPAAREETFLAGLDALIDGWIARRR